MPAWRWAIAAAALSSLDDIEPPRNFLLACYLFAHTTVHRVWAGTEVDNIAGQKALEKAGSTREGLTRGSGWRDGAWRDG